MKPPLRARCTAPDCRRVVHAHGLCKAHDQRSRRGQVMSPIRQREAPRGTTKARVVVYLSPAAASYLGRHGRGVVENFLEERAALEKRLALAQDAARGMSLDEFDACLNPPGATYEEPLP